MQKKTTILALAAFSALLSLGTAAHAQTGGTLDKAKAAGFITMGVRESSAPLSYALGADKFTGYHVELCERVLAAVLPGVSIRYMPVTGQNRMPLVQNGTVDLECGSTSNTAARKQQVAFAATTYITEARYAVKAQSGISSVEQLAGKTIATTTGTTLVPRLRKLAADGGLALNLIYGKDHSDSFLLLESGRAEAFAMDDNTLAGLIASSKNPRDYQIVGKPLGMEPIAIMLRKDDGAFKQAVDQAIKKMMASGELERLYGKWFLSPIPPNNAVLNIPMSAALKAAFASPNDDPAEALEGK
jgi:glutamate/aspartate transport system substrate-binding protein